MTNKEFLAAEKGTVRKDWGGKIRIALAYPNYYHVGMSNLGLTILYDLINKQTDTLAERSFAPWTDMEAAMREDNIPLYSLESKHSLVDFTTSIASRLLNGG